MSDNVRFAQAQPANEELWINIAGRNVLLSVYKGVRGARLYYDWHSDGAANVYNSDFKKIGTYDLHKH